MPGPHAPPPHGLSLPVHCHRIVDGDTIEAILPSGRSTKLRLEGFDAPDMGQPHGAEAKDALESLLDETADSPLTAFVPLPEDRDHDGKLDIDELLRALSFERVRAYLFAGTVRVDLWMIEHGHVKAGA